MAVKTTTEEFELPEKLQEIEEPPSNAKFVISLLTPGIFILAVAILFPIGTGIIISFTNSGIGTGYFGNKVTMLNYYELLFYGNVNTRNFWQFTYQTLFFSVVSLLIEFVLGLAFALILNKKFKGRGLARATLLIPWAIPTVASATLYRFEIFNTADQFGLVNSLITLLGGQPQYFFGIGLAPELFKLPILVPYSPFITEIPITLTMFTVIIIDVWKTTPFITLLILASLQIVSKDLYRAGDIAGASAFQKFRYITWPLIKPGVGIALIFRMMQALRVYDAIVVFNDKTVKSMTFQAVNLWLGSQFGLSSAVAVLLLGLIILFALFILKITRRGERKSTKVEAPREVTAESLKIKGEGGRDPNSREEVEGYSLEKEQDLRAVDISKFESEIEPVSNRKVKFYIGKRYVKKILFALSVIVMVIFCAAPFVWIVLRSFRDPYIVQTEFELFPKYFSFGAYEVVLSGSSVTGISFGRALLNGTILSGLTVVVVIVAGSFIGYAIAKFEFPFKKWLNSFIFSMNSLPPIIIIIPFYIQIILVGSILPLFDLRDNILGLVLPYAAFNMPLAVFILISFFREIPEDLWKAAKVDGATNFQIFRKVIFPLTIPGIFTCAILVFIAAWNELLFAQIFLTSPVNQTIPRTILRYVRNSQSLTAPWDTDIALMAATSLATVPLVIVVLIFQRKIISGLTRGAIKG